MRALMIIPALSLLGFAATAHQQASAQQQTGDPVADAARKARESKKDAPKPKKVYTDDDLKPAAPAPAPTSTSGAANGAQPAGQAGQTAAKPVDKAESEDTPKEDPNGEKAWRKRFQVQRDKVAKAERELDILNRELEKAQVEYYPDPQKAMTQQNTRADINEKQAKIEAKKKELEQLRQGLNDLEDQLRKSGGDPGWAR
jgi:hypothetical protein